MPGLSLARSCARLAFENSVWVGKTTPKQTLYRVGGEVLQAQLGGGGGTWLWKRDRAGILRGGGLD